MDLNQFSNKLGIHVSKFLKRNGIEMPEELKDKLEKSVKDYSELVLVTHRGNKNGAV